MRNGQSTSGYSDHMHVRIRLIELEICSLSCQPINGGADVRPVLNSFHYKVCANHS